MTIKDPGNIDAKLTKMYENQVTTNAPAAAWVDRSETLMSQMNFIAAYNKSLINFK